MQNQKESTFLDQDHKLSYRDFLHRNATEDVFETRNSLLQSVAGYLPDQRDVNEISSAFDRAYYYHKKVHQFRGTVSAIDGRNQKINQFQEYMVHPGAVAQILAEWKCDKNIIIGGLLHDTVEDTDLRDNPEIIKEWFGADGEKIFNLVIDTSKVTSLTPVTDLTPREIKERNLAKLLTAFYENPGAILIKLADRLHNMRTIHGLSEDKQKEFARETIEIFIPIARIVGMHVVADEMTEIAYRRLWPDQVEEVEAKIEERYKKEYLDPLLDPLRKLTDVHIDVQRPKFFNFISATDGQIVDTNIFPVRIISRDPTDNLTEFYKIVSYFQARMTTVNLKELRKDGRIDFDFGFGDMNLAVSIFEWDGYLNTDSSLISLHQLKPFDNDKGDIFAFAEDERVELFYLRKEYADTKLFKPQQRLRQYYEREKVLQTRLGLVSSAEALQSIQIPMIFVDYVEGEKVKPYVLSPGDTAWELAFLIDPRAGLKTTSVKINKKRKALPPSTPLNEGDALRQIRTAGHWTIDVYTLDHIKDPISKDLVKSCLQSIINAADAFLEAVDDQGKEMIIQAIEESGITSGLELIEKAELWKSQAKDRGEVILKKFYQEYYPILFERKYGIPPQKVREEPIVTLDKGWLLLKREFTDKFDDITDFEMQCGLETVDRQKLEEFIKAIWEYEVGLTSVSLTLPNKAGALARIASVAMAYGNIEDLDVARNVESIEADQVIFSFRIETVSEKSAKELQNRLGEMAAWMRKPEFQLKESESFKLEIKLPVSFSILPHISMLEAFGFTVDSFSRNRDRISLIIKGLAPIEVQMETTQEELEKLWQKIRREINKIQKKRMLQIPPVIKEETTIFLRRLNGNKIRSKDKKQNQD